MPNRTNCILLISVMKHPVDNEDSINGCQIGTQCPILHAKQDQVYPIAFSDDAPDGQGVSGTVEGQAVHQRKKMALLLGHALHDMRKEERELVWTAAPAEESIFVHCVALP
jgi:hypothetical protein